MGKNRIILPLSVFLIASLSAYFYTGKVQKDASTVVMVEEEVHPMPELLKLRVQNLKAESITLGSMNEDYKLIYFGQLSASDLDWEAVLKMQRLALQNFPKQLSLIFISLDPTRDTKAKLQKLFSPSAKNVEVLYPRENDLIYLTKAYGVHFQVSNLSNSLLNYTIDHNTWYFLTTPDYRILGSYPIQIADERLEKEIIAHMKQKH